MAEASSPGCHLVAALMPDEANLNYTRHYRAAAARAGTTRQEAFDIRNSHKKWARFDARAVTRATGGVAAAWGAHDMPRRSHGYPPTVAPQMARGAYEGLPPGRVGSTQALGWPERPRCSFGAA